MAACANDKDEAWGLIWQYAVCVYESKGGKEVVNKEGKEEERGKGPY